MESESAEEEMRKFSIISYIIPGMTVSLVFLPEIIRTLIKVGIDIRVLNKLIISFHEFPI